MTLRHKMPDLARGFRIPWLPAIPLIAMLCNALLAVYLFAFSPIAWVFATGWIVLGLLAYLAYFSKVEAMDKPKEILLEQVLVSRDYSVLVPVVDPEQGRILGQIGAILAQAHQGEILALHVARVPPQFTLGEGRLFLKQGRADPEAVLASAKARDVPVHTILRLGRNVAEAIRQTAIENASDLILLGWPGFTWTTGRLFGRVIDPLMVNPPTDVALVRHRVRRPLRSILVPVAGGPTNRLAVKLAVVMASTGENGPAKVTLLHIVPPNANEADWVRAKQVFKENSEGIDYDRLASHAVEGQNVVESVLEESKGYDLIVVGATEEPLLKNVLIGNIAEEIARRAAVTVITVERRSSPLRSFLRQTVLDPTARGG